MLHTSSSAARARSRSSLNGGRQRSAMPQTTRGLGVFFVYAEPAQNKTDNTNTRTNTHTHTHTHEPPHPRSPPQQRPGSLSIRRETLDEGEGAGAAAGLRSFPEESPRVLCARGHTPHLSTTIQQRTHTPTTQPTHTTVLSKERPGLLSTRRETLDGGEPRTPRTIQLMPYSP